MMPVHILIKGSLSSLGLHSEAINEFEKSIAIRSNDSCAHFNKGCAHFQRSEFVKAKDEFEITLSLDSTYPKIYEYLGKTYEELGEYKIAALSYSKAILNNPKNLKNYMSRAEAYAKDRDVTNAFTDFQYFITHTKENITYYRIYFAQLCYDINEYQKSYDVLKDVTPNTINEQMTVDKLYGDLFFAIENYEYALYFYLSALDILDPFTQNHSIYPLLRVAPSDKSLLDRIEKTLDNLYEIDMNSLSPYEALRVYTYDKLISLYKRTCNYRNRERYLQTTQCFKNPDRFGMNYIYSIIMRIFSQVLHSTRAPTLTMGDSAEFDIKMAAYKLEIALKRHIDKS